jgi:type I restriction enzyme R subunit
MSNFAFLAAEFPFLHEAAVEAERQAGVSPTAAAFFAGKTVEIAVKWAFKSDPNLKLPYQDNISALLHEPSFRRAAGEAVFAKPDTSTRCAIARCMKKRPSAPATPRAP